MEKMVGSSK